MADDRSQTEAMRQVVIGALKEMTTSLEGFHKKAKDASSEGGGLSNLNSLVLGMTKNLTGPVGLAAAVYAVGKSLESFSVGRIQLQNFSRDVGASVPMVNALVQSLDKVGVSGADAAKDIAKIGGMVKDLAAYGQGSELATMLRDAGVSANRINRLIATARRDLDQGIADSIKILTGGTRDFQRYASTQSGIAESHLQAMSHFQEEMNKVYVADIDAAEKWHEDWSRIALGLSNTWAWLHDQFVQKIEGIPREKLIDPLMKKMEEEKGIKPDPKSIFGRITSGDWGSSQPSSNFNDRFGTWPNEMMQEERTSNKTLIEIRDYLQKFLFGEGDGGGPGEGGQTGVRTYSGRRGMAERLGINTSRSGGGHAERSGVGGATRSGGGGAGITAPAGTPIQSEGLATVTTPDGKKFKVDENYKDNFQGFIDDYYKAGGKFGPSTGTLGYRGGNASGHPIGDAIDVNQVGRGIRARSGISLDPNVEDQLAEKWGFVSGNKWKNNDQGHFGIRSAKAAREALIAQGVTPSAAEHMTGLGQGVKGSWFDDHMTASGADASKVPGIALPSREGLGKMHEITGPDGKKIRLPQIDVGPAKWTGRGIDFSKPAMKQLGFDPTDKRFSFSRVENEERAAIDRTQTATQRIDAAMSATVDFKNMPAWVKTAVDDNGKFKNVRVSRSTPQAGKTSDPLGPTQQWSYD